MRKILVMLLVFALVIGCVGVVSATMSISGSASPKVNETITYSVSNVDNATTYEWSISSLSPTAASTTTSISYKFTEAKTYTLSVKAKNGSTELDNGSLSIQVTQVSPPVAAFTASTQRGGAPLTVTFTSTSTDATSLTWDFGVLGAEKPTTTSATYTYETPGTYTVKLTAKNSANVANETTKTITVTQVPEITIDVSPKTGVAPLNVAFNATATHSPTSYRWEFGDGSSATTQNANHIYTTAGTYVANFTATNANGTSVKKQETITVNANTSKYSVAIDATPLNGTAPLKVNFKINTTIPSSDRLKIEWDFGNDDDDDAWSGKESDSYTYNKSGTYTVTLVITSKSSNTKYQAASVKITVADLMASFTASPESGPAPLKVTFTDTTKGSPTDWDWTIYRTDGGSRTIYKELSGKNPSYTFESQGTYEVELRATKDSKSATAYKTITVGAKATTAPTTVKTTVTTAPTTAATTMEVRAAALSDDSPVPNPMDIIEEFLRLLKVMLVPENYSLAP
ncbi:MAG: PKD domain-containing protein [Methanocorpusculum sp.]|nr:PKD domain-containing protein [Methanocorpusculum sp.]